jgi:hypothetical protein
MASFGAICVIAAVALLIGLAGDDNQAPAGPGPNGTVRQFLNVALDDNGDLACRYLTDVEKRRVERAARADSCAQGFYAANLSRGGDEVNAFAFDDAEQGGRHTVTVSAGGSRVRFRLALATKGERNEFDAPSTSWRIASGAEALVGRTQDSS